MKKSRHHNFTLIEILAVLMILGIIFTLMLPSFNRMINGNKVDQMASRLKIGLDQAQSQAVTSRRNVALILPNKSGDWSDPGEEYCLGGYRLAYVTMEGSKNEDAVEEGSEATELTYDECTFEKWVPDSEWTNRPDGAYLVLVLPKSSGDYDQTKWMDGSSPTGAKGVTTSLSGVIAGGADALIKVKDLPDSSGNKKDYDHCAIVFSPYGEIRNPELKLVVAEAVENNGTLMFPSRSSSGNPMNYLVLGINKFTGRTSFQPLEKVE